MTDWSAWVVIPISLAVGWIAGYGLWKIIEDRIKRVSESESDFGAILVIVVLYLFAMLVVVSVASWLGPIQYPR